MSYQVKVISETYTECYWVLIAPWGKVVFPQDRYENAYLHLQECLGRNENARLEWWSEDEL